MKKGCVIQEKYVLNFYVAWGCQSGKMVESRTRKENQFENLFIKTR